MVWSGVYKGCIPMGYPRLSALLSGAGELVNGRLPRLPEPGQGRRNGDTRQVVG